MSLHQDLLDQARALARLDPNRPKQANLRRAVSSAYYSLYHYLIDQACRSTIGTHHRDALYRQVIARGFDHGSMKSACRAFAGGTLPRSLSRGSASGFVVSVDLRNLSQAFVTLQEQRHLADYDLTQHFSREDALSWVRIADQACSQFEQISDRSLKKFFLACLMTWKILAQRN